MDPFTLIMFAVLALLIIFMFRNSRKRQKDTAALQSQMVPGAEVMTSFGLYGTLMSIDEETNTVLVETSPGVTLKLHRQALTRVVEPVIATVDETGVVVDEAVDIDEAPAPEFGERTMPGTPGTARPLGNASPPANHDPETRDKRAGE